MKILYISYDGALEALGRSQVISYLRGLSSYGYSFYLLSYEKEGDYSNGAEVEKTRRDLGEHRITWIPLRYHKDPTVPATLYDIVCGIFIGGFYIVKEKIDIVHARSYVSALIALVFKKLFRTKFLFDMRGFWADIRIDDGRWRKGVLYKVTKYLEKLYLVNADHVVVLTNKAKEEIEKFPYLHRKNTKIDVIPTCVDLEKFASPNGRGRKARKKRGLTFIYAGSSGPDSAYLIEEIVDFFKVAAEKVLEAHLIILTHPSLHIAEVLAKKNIKRRDVTVNSSPHDVVCRWIRRAHAAVFFLRPGYSRQAACPTKTGEFLSCGIPVVINTGIGDLEEIVEHEGVGVVIRNLSKEKYEKGIEDLKMLLKKEDLDVRCRNTAMKYFSLDKGVEKYRRIYEALAPRGHSL